MAGYVHGNVVRKEQVVSPVPVQETKEEGLIPGSGRCPGGGHSNPLQYSYLENPMDRGTWWVTVYWVTKSRT